MPELNLETIFEYHAPKNDQKERYEKIRAAAKEFAFLIKENCPDSRERSVAFTNLQQTVMWANAAIAINE